MRNFIFTLIVAFATQVHGAPAAGGTPPAERYLLPLTNGTILRVHVKCPDDGKKRRAWPSLILFGGFETGAKSIELLPLKAPVCLITFQYPLELKKKLNIAEFIAHLRRGKRAIHETLEGVNHLVSWVQAQERFDKKRVTLVGASLGAPFTSIVAGQRADVAALVLVHGFGDVPTVIAHLLARKWQPKFGRVGMALARTVADVLWWYMDFPSPQEKLRLMRPHQRALMLTAQNDDLLPAAAVASARSALEDSAAQWTEVNLPGAHLRSHETALIAKLYEESIKWLSSEGLL